MKRTLAGMILAAASASSFAVAPGGDSCGWGNMLFEGQSGLPAHLVASITNGTSGNASFGMTTGTNGCSADGTLTYGGKSMINLSAVMDEFSEDVARGDGEVLSALAVSMGVDAQDREHFKATMHNNFATIFPSADANAEDVVAAIFQVMENDKTLAKYVAA